jgi:hypothetical protein
MSNQRIITKVPSSGGWWKSIGSINSENKNFNRKSYFDIGVNLEESSTPITPDFDETYGQIKVYERQDMIIVDVNSYREAQLISDGLISFWKIKKIGKNASGEIVYEQNCGEMNNKPDWIPGQIKEITELSENEIPYNFQFPYPLSSERVIID